MSFSISCVYMVFCVLGGVWLVPASAAQVVYVIEETSVYEKPNSQASEIERLPSGSKLVVANYPIQGFFKCRLRSGGIGWIPAAKISQTAPDEPLIPTVSTGDAGETETPLAVEPQKDTGSAIKEGEIEALKTPGPDTVESEETETLKKKNELALLRRKRIADAQDEEPEPPFMATIADIVKRPARIWDVAARFSIGNSYYGFQGINEHFDQVVFDVDTVQTGELVYSARKHLGVVGRLDYHYQSERLKVPHKNRYDVTIRSTGLSGGLELFLARSKRFDLGVKGLLGVGLWTNMSATAIDILAEGKTTEYRASPPLAILAADVAFRPYNLFAVYGEFGYRWLRTGTLGQSLSQEGSEQLPQSVDLDFSGPLFSIGVAACF